MEPSTNRLLILIWSVWIHVLFVCNSAKCQVYQPELGRFSIESGLSQSTVTDIAQDHQGFLWVGTQDGLNRFDGYQFKVYRDTDKSRIQLPNDYITRIVVADNGDLWIGTQQGLARYHKDLDQVSSLGLQELGVRVHDLFVNGRNLWLGSAAGLFVMSEDQELRHIPIVPGEQKGEIEVYEMISDDRNHLWLATNRGVYCIDQSSYQVHQLVSSSTVQWGNDVRSIAYISERLWLGTDKGLWSIHLPDSVPDTQVIFPRKFNNYLIGTRRYQAKSGVLTIFQDNQDRIWIGTESNGLMYLDPNVDQVVAYTASYMYDEEFFATTSVHKIFQDMYMNLWVGTLEQGIYKISFSSKKFGLMRVNGKEGNQLSNNRIRGLLEQGNYLWVGTAQGLNRLDRSTQSNLVLTHDPLDQRTLSSSDVKYITIGPDGSLWASTNNGLDKIDAQSLKVTRFGMTDEGDPLIYNNKVRGIRVMKDGTLWVGTLGGGVTIVDPVDNQLIRRFHISDSVSGLTNDNIMFIHQDANHEIWLTSYGGGLMRFNATEETFQSVPLSDDPRVGKLLSSIHEDRLGQLWVGSYGDGVFRVDPRTLAVQVFNTMTGLSSDVIYGAIPVGNDIWMSTNQGLNKFNFLTGQITIFQQSDGLQSNEFNTGSFLKTASGELLFGGTNGLNFFYPDSIMEESVPPRVAFTDFRIFNKSVVPGELIGEAKTPTLKTALKDDATITLHHGHNVFAFEFAALDFRNSNDIRYAYQLQGFDNDWIETGSRNRIATYTNLSPGDYTFLVRATNGDRKSADQPISLNIQVLPAYWQTWWFRMTTVATLLFVLSYWIYRRIKKAERRKAILEKEIEKHTTVISNQKQLVEQKNVRLKKLALRKDQLFFLLTHNMRGPLTSLSGFLNLLAPGSNVIQQEDFETFSTQMKHQVDDSLLLLDNTFYYSYSQFDDLQPNLEKVDFHRMIGGICDRYGAKAHHKNITLYWSEKAVGFVNCDHKLTSLILENLMSNAVKFAFARSSIELSLVELHGAMRFSIENEGPELDDKVKAELFDSDQENITYGTGKERGAGIGLSISHKLARLMGQEMTVTTNGSKIKFTLQIPNTSVHV